MLKTKVSIITVVYNGGNTIEQTIESVLNQNYSEIEYIIIDGNSTDGTQDIIKKYEDKISYWVSEPDEGIYDAMNKGIEHATGDIIGIINSDDWYERDAIRKIVEIYDTTKADWICGEIARIDACGKKIGYTRDSLYPPHPSMFVSSKVYRQYGKFKAEYKIAADHEFKLRLYANEVNRFHSNDIFANFRVNGISNRDFLECKKETYRIEMSYVDKHVAFLPCCTVLQDSYRKIVLDYLSKEKSTFLYQRLQRAFGPWGENVLIWGAGRWGRCLAHVFGDQGRSILFVDNDTAKWNTQVDGIQVIPPQKSFSVHGTFFVAIADSQQEIEEQIKEQCKDSVPIITLDMILALLEDFL